MKRFVGLSGLALTAIILVAASNFLIEGGKIHYREGRYQKADSLFKEAISRKMKPVQEAYVWHAKSAFRMRQSISSALAFDTLLSQYGDGMKWINEDDEARDIAPNAFYYGAQDLLDLPTDSLIARFIVKVGTKIDTVEIRKIPDEVANETRSKWVVTFLKRAIELSPDRPSYYILLGRVYLQDGEIEEAEKVAADLAQVDSTLPDMSYLKGRIDFTKAQKAQASQDTTAAPASYDLAAGNFMNSAEGYTEELHQLRNNIAKQIALDTTLIVQAAAAVEEIDETSPLETPDSIIFETKVKLLADSFQLADNQITKFLTWHRGYFGKKRQIADAYSYLGQSYLQRSQYADPDDTVAGRKSFYRKASEALGKSLEYNPQELLASYYKSLTLYYLREYDEAIGYLEKVAAAAPNDYYVRIYLGLCHLYKENPDYKKAEEQFLKAIEVSPDNPDGYRYMFILEDRRGNTAEADRWAKLYQEKTKQQGVN